MSFNVENMFVKCADQNKIADLVEAHWRRPSAPTQPDWGLPSSFDPVLTTATKRTLAISPPRDGWVVLVESKQIVDFALAKTLSKELSTVVLITQLFEINGESGYALANHGGVLESCFGENDDPLGSTRDILKIHKVPFDVTLFREAIQRRSEGWIMKQKLQTIQNYENRSGASGANNL